MASLNRVELIGRLGRDPEVRYTKEGTAVANLRIATSEQWTDKGSGEKQERTEWHTVVLWGRQAEIAQQYLQKGRLLYVEGRLETRKWQDQSGQDRYSTEIRAREFLMLDRGDRGGDAPRESEGSSRAEEGARVSEGGGPRGARPPRSGGAPPPRRGPSRDDEGQAPPPDEEDIPF